MEKICSATRSACVESCAKTVNVPVHLDFKKAQKEWHKVFDLPSLFQILSKSGDRPYMIVAGNTAHGKNCSKANDLGRTS